MTNATNNALVREPTVAEMAETEGQDTCTLNDATIEAVDSIEAAAQRAFNLAADNAESNLWKGVAFLALRLCGQQIKRTLTDGVYDAATDGYVFKQMLFDRAKAGGMIWRGTESDVAAIRNAKGNERKELLTAYVNAKGQKLVQGLESLRTYGFRLASYMRDNNAAAMVECARGGSPKDALERWSHLVASPFGATVSQLAHNLDAKLAPEKAAKAAASKAKREAAEAEAEAKETAEKGEATRAETRYGTNAPSVADIMGLVAALSDDAFADLYLRIANEATNRGMVVEVSVQDEAPAPLQIEAKAA